MFTSKRLPLGERESGLLEGWYCVLRARQRSGPSGSDRSLSVDLGTPIVTEVATESRGVVRGTPRRVLGDDPTEK